jgi:hypothetical protein
MKTVPPLILTAVLALMGAPARGQQPGAEAAPDWKGFEFLIGDFVAVGGGAPGEATGATSLHPIMNGVVLERLNRAEYPAANGRPASIHEDKVYFYRDPATRDIRALYFDGEPHTILYRVTVDAAARRVQMLSDIAPGQPRYRFTYTSDKADEFDVTFEIAPPDHPDRFAKYVGGKARRVGK